MDGAKVTFAVALMLLGLGHLYWPGAILKINEWAKRYAFNDAHVLLDRRKWGLALIILSLVVLLSGKDVFGNR